MSDQESSKSISQENSLIAERRSKLKRLRKNGNAFPNNFRRTATAKWLHVEYEDSKKEVVGHVAVNSEVLDDDSFQKCCVCS